MTAATHYDHQITTFRTLFRHIKEDGIYACEDLCSSYWKAEYGGGVRAPSTFVEFLKELIDEMNAWFWRDKVEADPARLPIRCTASTFMPRWSSSRGAPCKSQS